MTLLLWDSSRGLRHRDTVYLVTQFTQCYLTPALASQRTEKQRSPGEFLGMGEASTIHGTSFSTKRWGHLRDPQCVSWGAARPENGDHGSFGL